MSPGPRLRTPNLVLSVLRELGGMSQQDLAERLTEAAARRDDRQTVCDARMVRRWEHGEVLWPQDRYRVVLEDVFGRPVTSLGFVRRWTRTTAGWTLVSSGGTAHSTMRAADEAAYLSDLHDVNFGLQPVAVDGGSREWLSAEAAMSAVSVGTRRIDMNHVTQTKTLFEKLNALDHRQGGGALVRQAINGVKATRLLLEHGSYRDTVRSRLEGITGEMLIQSGWLAYDAGLQLLARRLYSEAMVLAQVTGRQDLAAHALSNMSIQANALGRGRDAVRFAESAQQQADGWATPRVRAIFAMHEARGWATLGAATECERALAASTAHFDTGAQEDDPAWIGYLNEAELATLSGVCRMDLGHHEKADAALGSSISDLELFARNRLSSATFYMRNLMAKGEIERACMIGDSLTPEIFHLSSVRILNQFQRVCDRMGLEARRPAIGEFLARVAHRIPSGVD